MSRIGLYQTYTAQMFIKPQLFETLVEYLIQRKYLFLTDTSSHQLLASRILVSSPVVDLSEQIIRQAGPDLFSFLRIKPKEDQVPELLTIRALPLDLRQAVQMTPALTGVIAQQPDLNNKLVLNVTPFVQSGSGLLADGIGFRSTLVRDALCRSFYTDTGTTWISPDFTQFVSKVYSIAMATAVSNRYRLDLKTLNAVTFFFALYYLYLMSDARAARGILLTQWRKFMVPDSTDQQHLYGFIETTLNKEVPESVEDVVALINALGIPRLELSRPVLMNLMRSAFSNDIMLTSFCLEYPPMLAYLILCAFSGMPIALSFKLKQFGFNKLKQEFEESIMRSRAFADSLIA